MRRLLAAVTAGLVVGLTVHLLANRPAADAVPALVAARPLPVGHVLQPADLQVRPLPRASLPEGHLRDPATARGRPLAAPMAAGEVLTPHDIRTADLLAAQEAGTVAVFLPLTEPAVAVALGPGDRVDVHSPLDGSVVLAGALVVGSSPGERPGVWLGVPEAGAVAVARARGADPSGLSLQVSVHHTPSGE